MTFQSVRSSIQRARATVLTPIPRNVEDVMINGPWGETWEQERFLLHLDGDWGIAIFASEENIAQLQRSSVLYMDATFRCCPRPYKQLFTILGQFHGFVAPLAYALMKRRTIRHYRQVLQNVRAAVRRSTLHNWQPEKIICDFEQSLWTSIETELPRPRLQGCYFHFSQSLWRKIQELGLARDYRRDERLSRFVRKLFAVGHLPLAILAISFDWLVNDRMTRRLIRRFPPLHHFIAYLRRTYIGPQATFRPVTWTVSNRDMDQRTNNHAESFHKVFGTAVGVRRPNLWMFLRVLKDQQANAENTFEAARRGEAAPRCRRKWRVLEERLTTLHRQYNEGDRTLDQFWEAVSYLVFR